MKEFQWRKEQLSNSLSRFRKKWEAYHRAASDFTLALDDLDKRVSNLDRVSVSLEDSVNRTSQRENRELRREIDELNRLVQIKEEIDHHGIEIGMTWAVYSFILDHICRDNPDARLVLESAIFPTLVSVMDGADEFIVDTLPSNLEEIIHEGKEIVVLASEEAGRSFLIEEVWEQNADFLRGWARDNLIPMITGLHPPGLVLAYDDMILWKESPADRDTFFSELFDMHELYRKNKAKIFAELGLADAEKKLNENY